MNELTIEEEAKLSEWCGEDSPQPKYGWCDYIEVTTGNKCKEKANVLISHNNKDIERKCDFHFAVTRHDKMYKSKE